MHAAAEPSAMHAGDRCFRCDYDVRGISDDQPCPECGLLAGRSRRPSDDLADARPRWLATISLGLWLILLASLTAVIWPIAFGATYSYTLRRGNLALVVSSLGDHLILFGWDFAAIVLLVGILLFTRPEPGIDHSRRLRRILIVSACMPIAALLFSHAVALLPAAWFGDATYVSYGGWPRLWLCRLPYSFGAIQIALAAAALALTAVVTWLMWRRRGSPIVRFRFLAAAMLPLAVLALAEANVYLLTRPDAPTIYTSRNYSTTADGLTYSACFAFVLLRDYGQHFVLLLLTLGCVALPAVLFYHLRFLARRALQERLMEHAAIVGIGMSLTLATIPLLVVLYWLGAAFARGNWVGNSQGPIILMLIGTVSLLLFGGWSILTLIRGALAFLRAARTRRQRWRAADRSLA